MKRIKRIGLALAVTMAAGCQAPQTETDDTQHLAQQAAEQFITEYLDMYPEYALYAGDIEKGRKMSVHNEASKTQQQVFVERWTKQLDSYSIEHLDTSTQLDFRLIRNAIAQINFEHQELKESTWNPSRYNIAGPISILISSRQASAEQKITWLSERLASAPAYYEAAKNNLVDASPKHTQLAIAQNMGGLDVLGKQLDEFILANPPSAEQLALLKQRQAAAIEAVESYIHYLEQKLPKWQASGRSYRLGSDLYERKFELDINVGLSSKQLYEKALADKAYIEVAMIELADTIWYKYFHTEPKPEDDHEMVARLLSVLSDDHVQPGEFVELVRSQIPELEAFVLEHDLITLDPTKPLIVRETPSYMRGVAGASISAPGPFDPNGNTYYNVTPFVDMPLPVAESWLREYNNWMVQILNIHEAIPGHYTQLVYSRQAPSIVKSILANGAMIEGWAVYAERMMLEEGYGDFSPELWLMYYKWNLRVIANTILDYSVHNLGMTEAEGVKLLMDDAFQERAEAEGKWRRVELTSVQLTSYYAGYRAIYDLREDYRMKLGERYSLKTFNETFLSYGSSPVPEIAKLMMAH